MPPRWLHTRASLHLVGRGASFASLETHAGVNIAPLSAATLLALLPVIVLLPFMQKYLVKGLSLGALK